MKNLYLIFQQAFRKNRNMPAGIGVVIIALVITTPLCNQVFSCGCTWPWEGLDSHCNFHMNQVPNKCPWCVSWLSAGVSLGLALVAGYCLSMSQVLNTKLSHIHHYGQILLRFSLGLSAFISIAFIGGIISALVQNYPLN